MPHQFIVQARHLPAKGASLHHASPEHLFVRANEFACRYRRSRMRVRLAGTALELLAEHEKLDLIVDGEHTSTGDTTKNVGASTLEE